MDTAVIKSLLERTGLERIAKRALPPVYSWVTNRRDFLAAPPIIIYQVGKVGSTSVYNALQAAGIPNALYHVHCLSEQGIADAARYHQEKTDGVEPWHLIASRALRRRLVNEPEIHWKVITLVRDPVAMDVSARFQNLKWFHRDWFDEAGKLQTDRVLQFLHKRFSSFDEEEHYFTGWFNRELKPVFGVDVFDHPFDQEKGYTIIREGHADVLVMQMESLDRCFGEAMAAFLNLDPGIKPIRANDGDAKEYGAEYRRVRASFKLDPEIAEAIYDSRWARHFYSESAREAMKHRWIREAAYAR